MRNLWILLRMDCKPEDTEQVIVYTAEAVRARAFKYRYYRGLSNIRAVGRVRCVVPANGLVN
jgi:hypothetical protein